ncbi:hypothetical protein AVEN_45376-1, partial [Araneus ventricosus]
QLLIIDIDIDTLIPARRKGVDGFSAETAGSGKHPFSSSSDSLTDAWAPTVHKLFHNQAFCGLCDAQSTAISRGVIRRFCRMSSFTASLFTSCGTVGNNERLPRVFDVYASRLITLKPPKYGAPCETLLSVHIFHPAINL